jgi:NADPH2:quinone reductase
VLVVHGTAGGPTPTLEIPRLNTGGSLDATRPAVVHYTATAEELRRRTDDLLGWTATGELRAAGGARFPLSEVGEAFAALESRRTTGTLLLVH